MNSRGVTTVTPPLARGGKCRIAPITSPAAEGRVLIGEDASRQDTTVKHNAVGSPNGRRIAFESNETGRYEIFCRIGLREFLMIRNAFVDGDDRPRIIVVMDWLDQLARRVPRQ